MKKNLVAAASLAGLLVLGACSSDDNGAVATTGDTAAATTAAADTAQSPAAADPAVTSPSVEPADLDASAVTWMATFCTGFVEVTDAFMDLVQVDPDTDSAVYADRQINAGESMNSLGSSLAALPAPALTDGENLSSTFGTVFTEQGPKLVEAGRSLAEAPSDSDRLQASKDATDAVNEVISGTMSGLTELTDAENEAVKLIPECSAMANTTTGNEVVVEPGMPLDELLAPPTDLLAPPTN